MAASGRMYAKQTLRNQYYHTIRELDIDIILLSPVWFQSPVSERGGNEGTKFIQSVNTCTHDFSLMKHHWGKMK